MHSYSPLCTYLLQTPTRVTITAYHANRSRLGLGDKEIITWILNNAFFGHSMQAIAVSKISRSFTCSFCKQCNIQLKKSCLKFAETLLETGIHQTQQENGLDILPLHAFSLHRGKHPHPHSEMPRKSARDHASSSVVIAASSLSFKKVFAKAWCLVPAGAEAHGEMTGWISQVNKNK